MSRLTKKPVDYWHLAGKAPCGRWLGGGGRGHHDGRRSHPPRRRAPDARPRRSAVLANHRPAGDLRSAPGKRLLLRPPRPAFAAVGHPHHARPPHPAAPPLPSPPRHRPGRQLPRRGRLHPPSHRRTLPPPRHDRGAPLHLGPGQPRPFAASGRRRRMGRSVYHHHPRLPPPGHARRAGRDFRPPPSQGGGARTRRQREPPLLRVRLPTA